MEDYRNDFLNNDIHNDNEVVNENADGAAENDAIQNIVENDEEPAANPYQGNPYENSSGGYSPYDNNPYVHNPYVQTPYGNTAGGRAGMGYNPYQNSGNSNRPVSNAETPKSQKKKSSGFGKTLGKCAAAAAVFGLVSGSIFTGVNYVGQKVLGTPAAAAVEQSESKETKTTEPQIGISSGSSGQAQMTVLTDVSDIAEQVMPSIVAITNTSTVTYQSFWGQTTSRNRESAGSGFIISQDEEYLYIASNNHVVADAETLSVRFSDDSVVAAEIQGTYESGDLAVVKVRLEDIDAETKEVIKVAAIGDSSALRVGEPTIAIGNALGYGQSVTTGIVSAVGRSITTQDGSTGVTYTHSNLVQTDAAINPGNSGGALLNSKGEVIGINSVKYSETSVEGIGYAIPMEDAMPILQGLIDKGKYVDMQTAYLGITGADVTEEIAQMYRMPQGVYIRSVYNGTGAQEAGLLEGDIISAIDGTELSSMDELKKILGKYKPGDSVTLTVNRQEGKGYTAYEVTVELVSAEQMPNE